MSYNAARIGMAGLGLNWAVQRQSRFYGPRPTAVMPVSKQQVQDEQIASLRKMINLNKQQTSNYYASLSHTIPAGIAYTLQTVSLTSNFTGSTEFPKQVIGDRYINKALHLRFDHNQDFPRFRVVVYWARRAGNTFTPASIVDQADPAAFIVLKDWVIYPKQSDGLGPGHNTYRINLKNKLTVFNFSSSVLESGDLKMAILSYNDSASATRALIYTTRLMLANK